MRILTVFLILLVSISELKAGSCVKQFIIRMYQMGDEKAD